MLKTKTFLIDFEILWFEKVKLVCHRGFHKCVWSGFLHLVVSYYYSFLLFRREVSSRFVNIIFREEFQMCSLLLQIRVSLHNVHSWKKIRAFNVTKWACDYGVSDCYFSHHTTRFNLNLRIETKKCTKWRVISKDIFMWGPFSTAFQTLKVPYELQMRWVPFFVLFCSETQSRKTTKISHLNYLRKLFWGSKI